MFKQKIFIVSFIVLILVCVFNYFGTKFYLYWIYRWYDIPMHILGGLCVSTFFLSFSVINNNKKNFLVIFFILSFIIISWEIFELIGKITFLTDNHYWLNTFKDILNGYIGGMIGYFFFIKIKK